MHRNRDIYVEVNVRMYICIFLSEPKSVMDVCVCVIGVLAMDTDRQTD